MMADTNNGSPVAANGGAEPIPQWKKELLQRRKNLAKTIGAAATQVHDSASTVAAALTTPTTPRGGPVGSPFASSTSPGQKATAFGAPVFVGHSHPSSSPSSNEPPQQQQQQQVLVKSRPTNTTRPEVLHAGTSAAEKQPLHTQSHSNDGTESTIGVVSTSNSRGSGPTAAVTAASAIQQQQSLSGSSSSSSTSAKGGGGTGGGGGGSPANNSGPVGKYAAATGSSNGGISASVVVVAGECEEQQLTRPAGPGETNSYSSEIGWKLKKNTSSASSSSVNSSSPNNSSSGGSTKMVAASAEEIIYEKNRFVGPGGGATTATTGAPGEVDSSEELKYGPGIVSKLRCRYLSLALRQSANKQRPSLNSMRRATSLNNLLDEESEDLSERETSIEGKDQSQDKSYQQQQHQQYRGREQQQNQLNLQQPPHQKAKTPDEYISTFQKSVQNSYTRSGRQTEKKNEYNRYNKQRGVDSLKRARSVEALVRYDHKAWERDIQKENLYSSNDSNVIILDEICTTNGTNANSNGNSNNNNCQSVAMSKAELIVDCVTIEDKIINGREKGDPKPKRLTSFIDADERPPPDVVRQTMKIFEANANRRGRPVARTNGAAGEVAAKVASYKSIISQEKPPITHPKPPLSPKKPNIIPRSTSPKSNGNTCTNTSTTTTANGLKDNNTSNKPPPALPKLDLNVIRSNLETTNNLKNSATGAAVTSPTPPSFVNQNSNNNTSTPLSVRVVEQQPQPAAYRLKYESPALSPNNTAQHKQVTTPTTTNTATSNNRPESPRFSTTAVATNMQNNTNSTAHTFVDSPSIQALTSKLSSLNIATSTPTSTRSPTPSDPTSTVATAAAAPTTPTTPPQAPPRSILQYATSDEEDDPEDQQREYSINSDRGSDSQPDDLELDDEDDDGDQDVNDEPDSKKLISRAAMENISKAGVTTQFRFNGGGGGGGQQKSHLPSISNNNGGGGGGAKLLATKRLNVDDHLSSNSSSTSSSPITVPATATTAAIVTQKPPVPLSRESLTASNGLKPSVINSISSSVTANNHSNSLLNHNNSSNANTSVNSNGSKLVINAESGASATAATHVSSDVKPAATVGASLTAREIEKNQINLEKSGGEEPTSGGVGNSATSGVEKAAITPKTNNNTGNTGGGGGDGGASGTGSGGDFFMAKWGSPAATATTTPAGAGTPAVNSGLVPAATKKKVKAPPPPMEANTMVFNFRDRKEVPDYIENDGIILRPRPRELPKPGESGFVVLGDLTLETSTDPDDSWAMGPPSPCDVEFANANIVINGKSSMRNKTSRDSKFKIQFDDSLTSTFEYPSETSLLEPNGFDDDATDGGATTNTTSSSATTAGDGSAGAGGGLGFADNGLLSHKNNLLSSMPLGSAPFASYTPVKAAIDTTFELGVTRTPSPSSSTSTTSSSNDLHHPAQPQNQQQQQHPIGGSLNGGGNHVVHQQHKQGKLLNGAAERADSGEPESIQYLKPASDEQTVNWSQGTRVTDLLF